MKQTEKNYSLFCRRRLYYLGYWCFSCYSRFTVWVASTAYTGHYVFYYWNRRSETGFTKEQREVVIQMLKVWVVSPVFSLVISYVLVKLVLESDLYSFVVLASGCIATGGILSLARTTRRKEPACSRKRKMTA